MFRLTRVFCVRFAVLLVVRDHRPMMARPDQARRPLFRASYP